MAEYVNKEELIKACNYIVYYEDEDDEQTFGISEARIDLMPTIDIVTCGECRYENGNKLYVMCSKTGCEVNLTHFCADGERKEVSV